MGNVILIGFMGSGKTTVGLRLSYRLRRTVIDEAYFRDRETDCLRRLLNGTANQIISVGGGLPLREENRTLLGELGQVFYLCASAETIYERVKHDTSRPLLQGDDPKSKIERMIKERDGRYRAAADVVIDVNNKDFEQILCEIGEHVR